MKRILAVSAGAIALTVALLLGVDHSSTGATSPPALTVGPASVAPRMTAAEAIAALAKDNGITTLPYAASVTAQFGAFGPVTAPAATTGQLLCRACIRANFRPTAAIFRCSTIPSRTS